MTKLTVILVGLFLSIASIAFAQGWGTGSNPQNTYVNPYVRGNGTAVQGYMRTVPNQTQYDNYGTRGNVNPYTGQFGTKSPRY